MEQTHLSGLKILLLFIDISGQTKVSNLTNVSFVDQNVSSSQIPVNKLERESKTSKTIHAEDHKRSVLYNNSFAFSLLRSYYCLLLTKNGSLDNPIQECRRYFGTERPITEFSVAP